MIYDAIIVGSGGAALSCAITLKEQNKNVLVLTKNSATSSQTSQAQGGMNGVIKGRNDEIENHINDTIKSAHGIGNSEVIRYMCENAQDAIEWLDSLGVPFNRNESHSIDARKLGGASHPRANYSSDYTGLKILQTLYDRAISLEIPIFEDRFLLNILKNDIQASGVSILNLKTSDVEQYLAKNIILATGGYGGVYHGFTTNGADTTGDGIIAAYSAGVGLENMEMIQFHPTALKDKFILISESARGEGGYLVDDSGNRFVDELKPRDVVAREIYKKLLNNEKVFLDVRHLGYEKIHHLMPQEYKLALDFLGLKMDQDLIPIIPAVHYTMGGIKVDKDCQSSLLNLYAIGECSSNGVHGANRLGGNSLLEIIVFGRKVGINLSFDSIIEEKEYEEYLFEKNNIEKLLKKEGKSFYKDRNELGKRLYYNVGVFRNKADLENTLEVINKDMDSFSTYGLDDHSNIYNLNLKHYLEFKNILMCSKIITQSALLREESRGAHFRSDFTSEENNPYSTIAIMEKGVEKLCV